MRGPKKNTAKENPQPAVLNRREIDVATNAFQPIPIRYGLAINSQPGHSTIGVNLETEMREALLGLNALDGKGVLTITGQGDLRQNLSPLDCLTSRFLGGGE